MPCAALPRGYKRAEIPLNAVEMTDTPTLLEPAARVARIRAVRWWLIIMAGLIAPMVLVGGATR